MEWTMKNSYKQNKLGSFVIPGGLSGLGGDTGMLPSQLYYCGVFRQQCRCGGCNGYCGPENGCPCNACIELLNFKVNGLGQLCRKGLKLNECVLGQEDFKTTDLYYCGRMKNQCSCGYCDGRCGPSNGCPCFDCLELVNIKVNRLGHFCRKGTENRIIDHVNKVSTELYYCGKIKNRSCGTCIGLCDPTNGCPCEDCFQLSDFKINRLGDVCRRGTSTLIGGHTGIASRDLFYCNKQKYNCHCGKCDGFCGPTNGCPCFDCLELLRLSVLPKTFSLRICRRKVCDDAWKHCPCGVCKNYNQQMKNSRGNITVKGDPEGTGGDTNVESKYLFYCGIVHNECRCGTCDGRCGPTNGCPCLACLKLYSDQKLLHTREKETFNDALPGPSAPVASTTDLSNETCVVCWDNQKEIILVPCGHYSFCKKCANEIKECSICRKAIEKRVKVFEC